MKEEIEVWKQPLVKTYV